MAGIGPPPKDPALRQRTNRKETAALLDLQHVGKIPRLMNRPERDVILDADGKPELDEHGKPRTRPRPWLPISRATWRLLWTSPMAARWLPAFVPGLRRMLLLCDDFERHPSTVGLASEIRLQQALYGIDPLGLARLQWGFAPATKKPAAPEAAAPQAPAEDPRKLLRMVAK